MSCFRLFDLLQSKSLNASQQVSGIILVFVLVLQQAELILFLFLGRARLRVESALWSHVCIVIVMAVGPPLAGYPPPKVACNDMGSLMESYLSWCGGPPPWLADPPLAG